MPEAISQRVLPIRIRSSALTGPHRYRNGPSGSQPGGAGVVTGATALACDASDAASCLEQAASAMENPHRATSINLASLMLPPVPETSALAIGTVRCPGVHQRNRRRDC